MRSEVLTGEGGNGEFTYYGYKLRWIFARRSGSEANQAVVIADILGRHVDLINGLTGPNCSRSYELRYLVRDLTGPEDERIAIFVLGRLRAGCGVSALADAAFELQQALISHLPQYVFERMNNDELALCLRPFPVTHVIQVLRRKSIIHLDRLSRFGGESRLGFKSQVGDGDPDAETDCSGSEEVTFTAPFVNTTNTMERVITTLVLSRTPLMVSIGLEPTTLTQAEVDELQRALLVCERHEGREARPGKKWEAVQAQAAAVYDRMLRKLMSLSDAPFVIRILIAGAGQLSHSLGDIIGTEITEAVGGGWASRCEHDHVTSYFSGGYDLIDSASSSEAWRTNALTDCQDLGFRTCKDSDSDGRLRHLVDATEAACAFRLPLVGGKDRIVGLQVRNFQPIPGPPDLPRSGLLLGYNHYMNQERQVFIADDDRMKHAYIVGRTGTGKTTMFESMILQDIEQGEGVGVIDPHGDLVEMLLHKIPPDRERDVIYLNPADTEFPFALNFLEWRTSDERYRIANEMLAVVRRLVAVQEHIGPMFEHFVRMFVLTLMANPQDPGTIILLPQLFIDKYYYKRYLDYIDDPWVQRFWTKEWHAMSDFHRSEMMAYIISKFDSLATDRTIRNIVGQTRSTFDIRSIMDEGKIIFVNLSKGRIGDFNAGLLGMLLVGKFQLAALSRADIPPHQRRRFYLYVDEFQNLATENFATILSEARKYGLGLILTNQFITQLSPHSRSPYWHLDPSVLQAVLGNVGTLVAFRTGLSDGELLEAEFYPTFNRYELVDIPNYQTCVSLLAEGRRLPAFTMKTIKDTRYPDADLAERLIAQSRSRYCRPRAIVDQEIVTQLFGKKEDEDDDEDDGGFVI